MTVSFRNGIYVGLLLALAVGLYLYQLWQPERQVGLHTRHLANAIETRDWSEAAEFIDSAYRDQWEQDRELLLARLRGIFHYTENLRIETHDEIVYIAEGVGHWSAQVTVDAKPNEVTTLLKERVNAVTEPWRLQWRQRSKKPWDWKLVHVSNSAVELPARAF